MASKDLKPKRRLGKINPRRNRIIAWSIGLLTGGSAIYAAYHYGAITKVEVAMARVRRADFVITARARGDIKASRSATLRAPQVPDLRITHLVANGTRVNRGDVIVEFDGAQHEQNAISQTVTLALIDSSVDQLVASQKMSDGADALTKIQSEYEVERTKLDAGKAAVLSAIEGQKARIKVGVSEGELQQVKASISAHAVGNEADRGRVNQRKVKAVRDLDLITGYLQVMQLRAPAEGVVSLLSNFRSRGNYGQSMPPFKEGDSVWPGAAIAEIPDLNYLFIDLNLDEVERGKVQTGQSVRIHVDAAPDKLFLGKLDFISPIGVQVFRGGSTPERIFPARALLQERDNRLQPGMSVSAEIVVHHEPGVLMVPLRSTFEKDGKPATYVFNKGEFVVRQIQVGKRNDDDIIVTGGLAEGEVVTLESPEESARRARNRKSS
jgi:HlyD family secretion protein